MEKRLFIHKYSYLLYKHSFIMHFTGHIPYFINGQGNREGLKVAILHIAMQKEKVFFHVSISTL